MVVLNPFAGTIDLTSSQGQKLWAKATSGTEKKFDLDNSPMNAENFKQEIDGAYKKFCWGNALNSIPIAWDKDTGNVIKDASIMKDFRETTIDEMIVASGTRFDCNFDVNGNHDFEIVDSNDANENDIRLRVAMIGEWILNSLSEDGLKTLANDARNFEYKNSDESVISDGALMLLIIFQKIMPSTKVGVTTKKKMLMNMDPSDFDQDVAKMMVKMQTLKTRIEAESKKDYDDFVLHLFSACEKSTNDNFCKYTEGLKSDWETDKQGAPKTHSEVVHSLTVKWNNLCAEQAKVPKGTSLKKGSEDPKYLALFTALTTSIEGLSEKVQTLQKSNTSGANGYQSKQGGNRNSDIAEWRKTKTFGEEVHKDDKQYYWCPQHQNGKGLYVTHHPLDHGKHPREWEHSKKRNNGSGNLPSNQNALQITDKLKAALTSNGISNAAAESLMSSLNEDSGVDFW